MGVSPWYWWADVPAQHHPEMFLKPGVYTQGPPAVKYRGIFINDEEPLAGGHERSSAASTPRRTRMCSNCSCG